MTEKSLLEIDERRDRSTVAATLRSLADQLEGGEDVTFTAGAQTATLAVPEHLAFELDVAREVDEFEVEIELSWDEAAPSEESSDVGAAAETSAADPTNETGAADPTTETSAADPTNETGAADPTNETGAADPTTETGAGTDANETADAAVDSVGPTAGIEEVLSQGQFQVYRDRADEWRWRLVHRNGNIIADSGEGYSTRQNAEKGLRSVMKNAPGAEVERIE